MTQHAPYAFPFHMPAHIKRHGPRIGRARYLNSSFHGLKDANGKKDSELRRLWGDVLGADAEQAASFITGLLWMMELFRFKGSDLGCRTDVKTTRGTSLVLRLKDYQNWGFEFPLITGQWPDFWYEGELAGYEIRILGQWLDKHGRDAAWFAGLEQLHTPGHYTMDGAVWDADLQAWTLGDKVWSPYAEPGKRHKLFLPKRELILA